MTCKQCGKKSAHVGKEPSPLVIVESSPFPAELTALGPEGF